MRGGDAPIITVTGECGPEAMLNWQTIPTRVFNPCISESNAIAPQQFESRDDVKGII
jgi:hypothetical protein